MDSLSTISSNLGEAIVLTLIHSTWILGIVGLLMFLLIHLLPASSLFKSRTISVLQIISLVGFVFGVCHFYPSDSLHFETYTAEIFVSAEAMVNEAFSVNVLRWIARYQGEILTLWVAGVLISVLRMASGLSYLMFLKKSAIQSGDYLSHLGRQIAGKLGVNGYQLLLSEEVAQPMTFGYFTPVILLPVSVVTQLDQKELQMILVHEFNHLKNKDFAFGMISYLCKVIFFYHPVVWIMDYLLDRYREQSCDERTVDLCGDSIQYAKTLLKVEQMKVDKKTNLALGFLGHKNTLINRIKSFTNMNTKQKFIPSKLMVSTMLLLVAFFIVRSELSANWEIKAAEDIATLDVGEISFRQPAQSIHIAVDTFPSIKGKSRSSKMIITNDGNKSIELKMENGEIQSLKIDGKVVPPSEYDQHQDLIKEDRLPGMGDDMFSGFDFIDDSNIYIFRGGKDGTMRLDSLMDMQGFNLNGQRMDFDFNHMFEGLDSAGVFRFEQSFPFAKEGEGSYEEMMERFFGMQEELQEEQRELKRFQDDDFFRSQDRKAFDFPRSNEGKNLEELIGRQLNRDGFLMKDKENRIQLSGKSLKINGKKQPDVIHQKYLDLFVGETGIPLNKNSKIDFKIIGTESKRKYKAF